MPKLSFIIPVYNGEKYINQCLNSILKEKEFNYEIIIVDDGSIDNSKSIIESFMKKDSRVKGHFVSHRGLSMVRNYGIKQSVGEYIAFVDIDDYISDNYFLTIKEKLSTDLDLLVFGYTINFIDENYTIDMKGINKIFSLENKADALKVMFEYNLFNFSWNKIINRKYILDISFSDDFYQGEDLAYNCELFKKINSVDLIEECLYFYIKTNSETMSSKFVKNYSLVLKNKYKVLNDLFESVDISNKYTNVLNDYMLKEYEVFVINLFKTKNYKDEDRINLIQENILNDKAFNQIINATPTSTYSKIFKNVVKKRNPKKINTTYKMLYKLKDTLGDSYLKLRKKVYLKDIKS